MNANVFCLRIYAPEVLQRLFWFRERLVIYLFVYLREKRLI